MRGKSTFTESYKIKFHTLIFTLTLFSTLFYAENFDNKAFTKVLIPAIYKEYDGKLLPHWISNQTYLDEHGYSVVIYQKTDPSKPYYLKANRGSENGYYYRYIVDHYDDFPSVAVFVHGVPSDHQPHFLDMFHCISPNATYMNINFNLRGYRTTENWPKSELWVEQCWRETLKVVWNLTRASDLEEFHRRVPANKPVFVSCYFSQQFILSREMVLKRPLEVWKKLLHMLGEDEVCVHGEPDYENLYAYHKNALKVGPELPSIEAEGEGEKYNLKGWGRHTQGGASEHLSHVIFGLKDLDMSWPTMDDICQNFLPNCPNSPCKM